MVANTRSPAFIVVSDDPIAERAHEIYVERGRTDGFDSEDWFQAERELKVRTAVAPRKGSRPVKNA